MKAKLYFMGQYRGIIDIDPKGLLGSLLGGKLELGAKKLDRLKKDLEKIPGVKVTTSIKIESGKE